MAVKDLKGWGPEPDYDTKDYMNGWSVPKACFFLADLEAKLEAEEELEILLREQEIDELEEEIEKETKNLEKMLGLKKKVYNLLKDILDVAKDSEILVPNYVEKNLEKVTSFYKKGEFHYVFTDEDNKDLFEVEIAEEKIKWYNSKSKC